MGYLAFRKIADRIESAYVGVAFVLLPSGNMLCMSALDAKIRPAVVFSLEGSTVGVIHRAVKCAKSVFDAIEG